MKIELATFKTGITLTRELNYTYLKKLEEEREDNAKMKLEIARIQSVNDVLKHLLDDKYKINDL